MCVRVYARARVYRPSLLIITYKYSHVDHVHRMRDLVCAGLAWAACDSHPACCSACFLCGKVRVDLMTRKQSSAPNLWLNLDSTTTFRHQLFYDGTTCRRSGQLSLRNYSTPHLDTTSNPWINYEKVLDMQAQKDLYLSSPANIYNRGSK